MAGFVDTLKGVLGFNSSNSTTTGPATNGLAPNRPNNMRALMDSTNTRNTAGTRNAANMRNSTSTQNAANQKMAALAPTGGARRRKTTRKLRKRSRRSKK